MYGETGLAVARFHGLGNPVRQFCHRWRDNVPDRLVLVAQAVLVDGVLEERFGEIGISDFLDRVKPLVRLPERVVRVQLQNVGKAIKERSQLACTGDNGILLLYACCFSTPPCSYGRTKLVNLQDNEPIKHHTHDVDRVAADKLVVPRRVL